MKIFYDLFPLLLFLVAFKFADIYVATVVAIVSSFLQVAWFRIKYKRFETMHLVTMAILVVMGGLTLLLKDERFIKWKPTLVNWSFAIAFLVSHFVSDRPIIERVMGHAMKLPKPHWYRLSIAWVIFFVLIGCLNIYVAFSFATEVWVNFKVFGIMGLTFVFVIVQGLFLSRYIAEEASAEASTSSQEGQLADSVRSVAPESTSPVN